MNSWYAWVVVSTVSMLIVGVILRGLRKNELKKEQENEKAELEETKRALEEREEYLQRKLEEYEARLADKVKEAAEVSSKLRSWDIPDDKIEDILMLKDELGENRTDVNHYRLWSAIHDIVPETKGVKCSLKYDEVTLTVKELL